MSGRLARRLLKEQSATKQNAVLEDSENESIESPRNRNQINLFDLLGEDEVTEDREKSEEDEGKPSVSRENDLTGTEEKKDIETVIKGKKKKKNKAKKKANSKKETLKDQEASIDEILQELHIQEAPQSSESVNENVKNKGFQRKMLSGNVLSVEAKFLKAEEELRRIFGSRVINEAEKRESMEKSAKRHLTGGGRRPGSKFLLKKFFLVQPGEDWVKPDQGLSLEYVEEKDGFQYFKYVHSAGYSAVQERYNECVESHEPNLLTQLLAHFPFHVDSLLALAELYRSTGEYGTAQNLLERALYALEYAWHPWYNASSATCRIPYDVLENRTLFHCLYRHMQLLSRRGCHRTALEVGKLLLSLDPSDPLGILFSIDFHAVRSQQYRWLLDFVDHYGAATSASERSLEHLGLFPNFCFSLAVARYRLSEEGPSADLDDDLDADVALEQALAMHPGVLGRIVEKAPIKVDSDWSKVLKCRIFSQAPPGGPSLEHLYDLYVVRSSVVWRAAELQAWLKKVALKVVQLGDSTDGQVELSNWLTVRREAFPESTNQYKHLLAADFADSASTLPVDELAAIQAEGGAMLPRAEMLIGPPQQEEAPGGILRDPRDQNAFRVFLEALLPWNNFALEEEQGEGRGEGGRGGENQENRD